MQGNARRLLEKRCDGSSPLGRLSKLGLAPILWFMILLLLLIYTNSVVLGITLASSNLLCVHHNQVNIFMHAYYLMNPLVIAASNLPKLTTGIGALAWLGFILATSGLFLFYRCSRYVSNPFLLHFVVV